MIFFHGYFLTNERGPISEAYVIRPGGFILESGWESDFDLKNWLFLVSRCSHRRIYSHIL